VRRGARCWASDERGRRARIAAARAARRASPEDCCARARFRHRRRRGKDTKELADRTLTLLEVDSIGLDVMDRRYLDMVAVNFGGGRWGSKDCGGACRSLATPSRTLSSVFAATGFLQRTPRGRVLTPNAFRHLGLRAAAPRSLGCLGMGRSEVSPHVTRTRSHACRLVLQNVVVQRPFAGLSATKATCLTLPGRDDGLPIGSQPCRDRAAASSRGRAMITADARRWSSRAYGVPRLTRNSGSRIAFESCR